MLRELDTRHLVYHYTKASTALEFILHDMALRLNSVDETNDPGDSGVLPIFVGHDLDFHALSELHQVLARRKLACFSRDEDETERNKDWPLGCQGYARDRMWAQYADNHRGVCLFLDLQALQLAFRKEMSDRGSTLSDSVEYSYKLPVPRAPYDPNEDRAAWLKRESVKYCEACSFRKRPDWESEREYRLVFIPNPSEQSHRQEKIHIGDALRAICVGHRFPEGLKPCIRETCDRLKISAFQLKYSAGDSRIARYYCPKENEQDPLSSLRPPRSSDESL